MVTMKIIDLNEEYEKSFFVCLEDWSGEMKEAGDHKARWYGRMKEKGVRVKLALDENGVWWTDCTSTGRSSRTGRRHHMRNSIR